MCFLVHFEPIWVEKMIKNIFFCYNPYNSMFPQAKNTLKQIFFWFLRCLVIFSHFVQSSFTIADTQSYHNNLFKQGNLTAQSVTENFKWKFCDHNFQKKNGWSIIKKSIGKVLVYVGDLNETNATIGLFRKKVLWSYVWIWEKAVWKRSKIKMINW